MAMQRQRVTPHYERPSVNGNKNLRVDVMHHSRKDVMSLMLLQLFNCVFTSNTGMVA
jgi:hypothetical protein